MSREVLWNHCIREALFKSWPRGRGYAFWIRMWGHIIINRYDMIDSAIDLSLCQLVAIPNDKHHEKHSETLQRFVKWFLDNWPAFAWDLWEVIVLNLEACLGSVWSTPRVSFWGHKDEAEAAKLTSKRGRVSRPQRLLIADIVREILSNNLTLGPKRNNLKYVFPIWLHTQRAHKEPFVLFMSLVWTMWKHVTHSSCLPQNYGYQITRDEVVLLWWGIYWHSPKVESYSLTSDMKYNINNSKGKSVMDSFILSIFTQIVRE